MAVKSLPDGWLIFCKCTTMGPCHQLSLTVAIIQPRTI